MIFPGCFMFSVVFLLRTLHPLYLYQNSWVVGLCSFHLCPLVLVALFTAQLCSNTTLVLLVSAWSWKWRYSMCWDKDTTYRTMLAMCLWVPDLEYGRGQQSSSRGPGSAPEEEQLTIQAQQPFSNSFILWMQVVRDDVSRFYLLHPCRVIYLKI